MKFRTTSLLLLPGVCMIGALFGGMSGALTSLEWYAVSVLGATGLHALSAFVHRRSKSAGVHLDGVADAVAPARDAPTVLPTTATGEPPVDAMLRRPTIRGSSPAA